MNITLLSGSNETNNIYQRIKLIKENLVREVFAIKQKRNELKKQLDVNVDKYEKLPFYKKWFTDHPHYLHQTGYIVFYSKLYLDHQDLEYKIKSLKHKLEYLQSLIKGIESLMVGNISSLQLSEEDLNQINWFTKK